VENDAVTAERIRSGDGERETMNKRRFQRAILFAGIVGLLLTGGYGLWSFLAQRHQYALNRQLIAALVKRDTSQALLLVNEGADPNTPYTPQPPPSFQRMWNYLFHRSALPTNESPTAFLVVCGAYSDTEDMDSIMNRPAEVPQLVQSMLQHSANINARDKDKWTPLMWAAWADHPKTVDILLEGKANVNAQDASGCTALYRAVQYNTPGDSAGTDIIRQLLGYGADPNLPNEDAFTSVQLAQLRRPDLVAPLRRAGAK
jgi:ankyrin repeat protein